METTHRDLEQAWPDYDVVVANTLSLIFRACSEPGVIRLRNFDHKNKEHLFVLHVAYTARDLWKCPIEIQMTKWQLFKLNWSKRKGYDKVSQLAEWREDGIDVPVVVDAMRKLGADLLDDKFTLEEIYEAYYA